MCDSAGVVRRSLSGRENWRTWGGGWADKRKGGRKKKLKKGLEGGQNRQRKTGQDTEGMKGMVNDDDDGKYEEKEPST